MLGATPQQQETRVQGYHGLVAGLLHFITIAEPLPLVGAFLLLARPVTITPSPISICNGATFATMTYSVTGSPNEYSITWNSAAQSAGLANVTNAALPMSHFTINIPSSIPEGTYTGSIVL